MLKRQFPFVVSSQAALVVRFHVASQAAL